MLQMKSLLGNNFAAFAKENRLQVWIFYRKVMLVMQNKYSKPPTHPWSLLYVVYSLETAVRFEILAAVLLKKQIIWNVMLCCWMFGSWWFKEKMFLHVQCQAVRAFHSCLDCLTLKMKAPWSLRCQKPLTQQHNIISKRSQKLSFYSKQWTLSYCRCKSCVKVIILLKKNRLRLTNRTKSLWKFRSHWMRKNGRLRLCNHLLKTVMRLSQIADWRGLPQTGSKSKTWRCSAGSKRFRRKSETVGNRVAR